MCWGRNDEGQIGSGSAVVSSPTPLGVAGLTDATHISLGNVHACARRATGAVVCWGWNYVGQLGNNSATNASTPVPVSGLTDALFVAAGGNLSCAWRASGAVVCWGENSAGQLGDGTTTNRRVPVTVIGLP